MIEYRKYRRSQIAELADWQPGFDMSGVSISDTDKAAGSPQLGDKIARNPKNHADRWLVASEYFTANFEAKGPRIVCLCGSSRFVAQMACVAWALERDEGYIVLSLHLLPDNYPGIQPDHMAEHEGFKEHFDNLHKRKIDLSDEILVFNLGGYIGESTRSEIEYAKAHGKPVKYMETP